MKSIVQTMIVVFAFCTLVFGQNSSQQDVEELKKLHLKNEGLKTTVDDQEKRLDKLTEQLRVVSEKDKTEAKRLKADVRRLFPCCPLADIDYEGFGLYSGYTFRTEKTSDGYFAVSLFYENGEFSFSKQDGNHGFIMNVGKIPLENVGETLPQFAALAKYQPPFEIENIKTEFTADGITFQQSVAVKAGETYILRAVSYAADGNIDSLYALKVAHRDADGSIIVFIKKLKDLPLPKKEEKPKYSFGEVYKTGMNIKIQGILREQEITGVRLEYAEWNLFVRGSVPKGKSAEVIKLVTDLNPEYTVKNELTEK